MDDLRERIRRDLDHITPPPTAFDDAMGRVRRRKRNRKARAGAMGLVLTAALAVGLWSSIDRDDGRPTRPASPSAATGLGDDRLFLSGDGEAWVVDPATETVRHMLIPELSPGDPPHRVVRRGNVIVAWGYRTLILDPRQDWAPRVLASDSLIFIPSAAPDRVWVSILDEEHPEHGMQAVREMTVEGVVTVPDTRPPDGNLPIAAVNQGLVFQEQTGLLVWDPRAGTVVDRLSGEFPLAWEGDLLAWCDHGCEAVHITDFGTGEDVVVPSPPGTSGFEALQGAFSPDGTTLAVALRLNAGSDADRQLGLIDVVTGSMTLVDNATVDTGYVFIDWAPSGRSVFITGGQVAQRRVVEYRIGEAAAEVVHVEVGDFYGMAVVDVSP
jgi:hypothetical protein